MNQKYNNNHVKIRMDGQGDGFSNQHRSSVPHDNWMIDIDGVFGSIFFADKLENNFFAEVEPDLQRGAVIRGFGFVAFYDRKKTWRAAFNGSSFSLAAQLALCRFVAKVQPVQPKFFFVIGENSPPWYMVEIDIFTGLQGRKEKLGTGSWKEIWKKFGLLDIRKQLREWVTKDKDQPQTGLEFYFKKSKTELNEK